MAAVAGSPDGTNLGRVREEMQLRCGSRNRTRIPIRTRRPEPTAQPLPPMPSTVTGPSRRPGSTTGPSRRPRSTAPGIRRRPRRGGARHRSHRHSRGNAGGSATPAQRLRHRPGIRRCTCRTIGPTTIRRPAHRSTRGPAPTCGRPATPSGSTMPGPTPSRCPPTSRLRLSRRATNHLPTSYRATGRRPPASRRRKHGPPASRRRSHQCSLAARRGLRCGPPARRSVQCRPPGRHRRDHHRRPGGVAAAGRG